MGQSVAGWLAAFRAATVAWQACCISLAPLAGSGLCFTTACCYPGKPAVVKELKKARESEINGAVTTDH